jgi:hypothetical protein
MADGPRLVLLSLTYGNLTRLLQEPELHNLPGWSGTRDILWLSGNRSSVRDIRAFMLLSFHSDAL